MRWTRFLIRLSTATATAAWALTTLPIPMLCGVLVTSGILRLWKYARA